MTVNCDGTTPGTPGECPECPDQPPGSTPEDPCLSLTNVLEIDTTYKFSQMGITPKGLWKEFFLASSSVNINDSSQNGNYHGVLGNINNFPGNINQITQAIFMLRQITGDVVADEYSDWTYHTEITEAVGNELLVGYGGQIKDKNLKCLGWVPASGETDANFIDGG